MPQKGQHNSCRECLRNNMIQYAYIMRKSKLTVWKKWTDQSQVLHQLVTSRWLASHCQFTFCSGRVWRSLEGLLSGPWAVPHLTKLQAIDRLRWIIMPNIFFFVCFCLLGTWNLCDDQEFTIASFWLIGAGNWHSLIASCATFLAQKLVFK
jgi:hypothetical protein